VRWGIGDALIGLLIAQVAVIGGGAVALRAFGYVEDGFVDTAGIGLGVLTVLQMFLWLGYGGWTVAVSHLKGNGVVADYGWKFRRSDIWQGLLAGIGTQLLLVPAIYLFLFLFIGEQDVSEAARDLTERATTSLDVVLLVLIVAVGAPIIEELFFRGLLLRALQRRWGEWPAIIISTLVFAAVHFQTLQFPALALFGLLAGWLTVRSGRLGPAIWTHVGFNATTVSILLLVS
jgi:uncharacterized protein